MIEIIKIIKKSETKTILFVLCIAMALISSLLAIIPAQFLGFIITVLASDNEPSLISNLIVHIKPNLTGDRYQLALIGIICYFSFSLFHCLFRNLFCYISAITSEKVITSIRKNLYAKMLKIDFLEYLDKPKGQFIYTIMNDTQRLEYIFARPFYTTFSDLFDLIWISLFLILIDPIIWGVLLISAPLLYIASIKMAKIQKRIIEEAQKLDANLTTEIEQTLSGYEMIKSFNGEEHEKNSFYDKADRVFDYRKKSTLALSLFFPIEGSLRIIGISIILLYAINKINLGIMEIGMVAILIDYVNKFYSPLRNITQHYQTIQAGIISARRINDFFNIQEETTAPKIITEDQHLSDKIVFEDVFLNINKQTLIKNINLNCSKGSLILIKGHSGCGKTSLLRILLGFYPVDNNRIYIYGKDINSFDKQTLRTMISYAGQSIFLKNTSILNNIIYPNTHDISKINDIKTILRKLNLKDKDVHEIVGEEGKNLSGGEKSRISFTRALVRNANILLLDEITAALDKENEDIIIDILNELKGKEQTIFLISHSNNEKLIKIADQVIYLH